MIWITLIAIVIYIGYGMYKISKQDEADLKNILVYEKFDIISKRLNNYFFEGNGEVVYRPENKNVFCVYKDNAPIVVLFTYTNSSLTIEYKYKYFMENEIIVKETFRGVKEITEFEQESISNTIINKIEASINEKVDLSKK